MKIKNMFAWYWWIVIAVAAAAVIGSIIGIILSKNKSSLTLGKTIKKFSGVSVKDLQHNIAHITSGDHITLSYTSKGTGNVRWDYQVGNATKPFEIITQSTTDNPFKWQIPGNIFGTVRFRVTSIDNLNLVAFSSSILISPTVTIQGLGDIKDYALANIGTTVKFKYSEQYNWLEQGGVMLEAASESDSYKTYTPAKSTNVRVLPTKREIEWDVRDQDFVEGLYKIRFSTKSLKSIGFPHEITYDMPNTIGIQEEVNYNPEGTFCNVTIKHSDGSGRHTGFAPGETVTLQITDYIGALPTHDWYYTKDQTNFSTIVKASSVESVDWTIPSDLNGVIYVKAVDAGTPSDTEDITLYGQSQANIGIYMIMVNDSSHKKPVINYGGKKEEIISHVRIYIMGSNNTVELSKKEHWTAGWYYRPNEASIDARVLTAVNPVTNVYAVSGDLLPSNVTICDVTYKDPGYQLGDTTVPLFISVNLPINGNDIDKISIVSQAQYTLQP